MNNRSTTLSIKSYALLFLLLVATFFISLGFYTLNRIDNARTTITQQNYRAAEKELFKALDTLTNNIAKLSHTIATWDELFQQLASPAYYSYWRNHRLLQSAVLPEYIQAAELFDQKGRVLADLEDSRFPSNITLNDLTTKVEFNGSNSDLIMYLPIKRSTGKQQIEGYLGVRLPFHSTLMNLVQFRYIQEIQLPDFQTTQSISLNELKPKIHIKIKSNPVANEMVSIIKTSITQIALLIGTLSLIFYFFIVYLLGRPLIKMSSYIDNLRSGNNPNSADNEQDISFISELEKIKTSLNQYHHDLEKAQSNLDDKNQELWKLAHHDSLTNVLNRRAFDREWKKSQQLLRHNRIGISLILFDVNRFKAINDSYGHQVGDQVLIIIGECLQNAVRKSEKLFRIGGDEFASIIIGNTKEEEIALAKRCVESVDNYSFSKLAINENISISCGIAHCQANDLETLNNLQWQADIAVYQAKRPTSGNPVMFHKDMVDGTEAVFSSWMSDAVHEAVTHGTGIKMHYQPIADTITRQTKYFEALIRIRFKDEWIPPSHIFPIIGLRQLETELDLQVINKVAHDLNHDFIVKGNGVSINLSAESIVQKDLCERLSALTPFTQTHYIVLEVTETSLITQLNSATQNLVSLRKLGFKIALDDFGSGYSSLLYLTKMPVDIIKFDIALIQGMVEPRLGKLVHEMAKMLHQLGYDLVAEGIETELLLDKVKKAGFHLSQGYLLGKPTRQEK
ncbi:MAG: bifunctional diguanylate cyclase/phosphodiesterase [Gammaproteobacteria bacterium]|nr:bifunctional diguanylate cyclase/phosphodiesterase [Gammaproteobacteria bacterium]